MSFQAKWRQAAARNTSLLCVGLDPDPAQMPAVEPDAFLRAVIEATADLVCCYKPNLAFFEALGRDGYRVLAETLAAVPPGIPVLGDAKRGDIGHTAAAYARALFDVWGFDAVTVNPWGGADALAPFLDRADRGVFIWCRGSNPGARDFQDLPVFTAEGARPLYEVVALRAQEWNRHGNVGLVVGVTYPEEAARLRRLCPELPFLMPGLGAQGGDAAAAVRAVDGTAGGFLINVSRQVLYASSGPDFAQAARTAAQRYRDEINRYRADVAGAREPTA
ncbi:MAG: orotidine-5'-phosphate decarboxylase [Chloroflexota bacterium]